MALDLGIFLEGAQSTFKVKVSNNDTQAQYLIDKLISSDGSVTITETNDGGIETIDLTASGGNTIYTADGSLTGNRIVTMGGSSLTLSRGQTILKGSGDTLSTISLLVENNSGVDALIVRDDLRIGLRGNPDNDFILNVTGEGTSNAKGSIQAVNSLGTKMFSVDNEGTGFFNKDLRIVNRAAINSTINSTWTLEVKGFTSNGAFGTFNFINSSNQLIMKGVNNQEVIFGGAIAVGQTGSPTSSAIIEMTSTSRGFLPPRMTTTEKNAISTPATGLVLFDTTLAKLCVYTGAAWETVTSA